MTRGLKSTEFIISLLCLIAGVAMAIYGISAGEIMAALSVPSVYVTGRSAVKAVKGESE